MLPGFVVGRLWTKRINNGGIPMRKIFYGRHGKADPAADGQKDIARMLGEVGIGQANARAEKLNGTEFGLVISSPAPRAHKTGAIVTGKPESEIVLIDALYPSPDDGDIGTKLDKLFQQLGYKPVADYLQTEGGAVVTEWAMQAHAECLETIERAGYPDVIGIFGHAVCSQALAMEACAEKPELVKQIAQMNLGECHMIVVNVDDKRIPTSVELIAD